MSDTESEHRKRLRGLVDQLFDKKISETQFMAECVVIAGEKVDHQIGQMMMTDPKMTQREATTLRVAMDFMLGGTAQSVLRKLEDERLQEKDT
jgi:hypothetical protein